MRRLPTAAVAAAFFAVAGGHPAHAVTYLTCNGGFHQTFGDAGRNQLTYATVARQDDGRWSVTYLLRDGRAIERSSQFNMTDASDAYHTEWMGWRGAKQMHGQVLRQNGDLIYSEELSGNGRLLGSNWIDCGPDTTAPTPTYQPPVVAQTPAPTMGGSDVVPFTMIGHSIHVTVMVGSTPTDMILDTGAEISSISTALADSLLASGQAHEVRPIH